MREIKFRVWSDRHKQMIFDWGVHLDENILELSKLCGDDTLMQYTGLKDKNGKEIYEGDVVQVETYKYGEQRGPIEFYAPFFGVRCWAGVVDAHFHLGEVIGNIYENPELLGNENQA